MIHTLANTQAQAMIHTAAPRARTPSPHLHTRLQSCRTASLSEFRAPTPKLLFGAYLKEVAKLEESIAKQGLMTPLKVTYAGNKLVVIDGRKRLSALRRMRFKNTLPRSLVNIPFVLGTEPVPHLLSAQEQYRGMTKLRGGGASQDEMSAALCLSAARLHALQAVDRLSPRLKAAFMGSAITLKQAEAFAALPVHSDQDSLMLAAGPFAAVGEILKAITTAKQASGKTEATQHKADNVISMPTPPLKGLAGKRLAT